MSVSDCVSSLVQCGELLQAWCGQVFNVSLQCAELLQSSENAAAAYCICNAERQINAVTEVEIGRFKAMVGADWSHHEMDELKGNGEKGKETDSRVIIQCLARFISAQSHIFQSAAQQLVQFTDVNSPCWKTSERDLMTSLPGTSTSSSRTASSSVSSDAGHHNLPAGWYAFPASSGSAESHGLLSGISKVNPSETNWHSAGRCATDEDLNLVIKLLSQSGPARATSTVPPPTMGSIPECSISDDAKTVGGCMSSGSWHRPLPLSLYSNEMMSTAEKQATFDTIAQRSLKTNAWPFEDSLAHFAATLRAGSSPSSSRCGNQQRNVAPHVYVQDAWPSLGTEIWSQNTGWSPEKGMDGMASVPAVVDSCSSDESCNGEVSQQFSALMSSNSKRRHSSGERNLIPFSGSTPNHIIPVVTFSGPTQMEVKSDWNLILPGQGSKDKSGVIAEGHRPLFMQRSDPLAQRSFTCWPLTGGSLLGSQLDGCPADSAAGSVGALAHQQVDRTF